MTDHDAMAEALAETKSLVALVWLVEHGREVEFRADGVLPPGPTEGFPCGSVRRRGFFPRQRR